jgi:hypothetical protein
MSTLSMSKFAAKMFAVILAAAPLTAASHAQIQSVSVNVPFGFETPSKHLPAGIYTVQMEEQHVLQLRSKQASVMALYMPDMNRTVTEKGKVVFTKRGGQYFLRDIYLPGSSIHAHCSVSKREKKLLLASVGEVSPDVELAFLETPR